MAEDSRDDDSVLEQLDELVDVVLAAQPRRPDGVDDRRQRA
jgi:hypothetical protein